MVVERCFTHIKKELWLLTREIGTDDTPLQEEGRESLVHDYRLSLQTLTADPLCRPQPHSYAYLLVLYAFTSDVLYLRR